MTKNKATKKKIIIKALDEENKDEYFQLEVIFKEGFSQIYWIKPIYYKNILDKLKTKTGPSNLPMELVILKAKAAPSHHCSYEAIIDLNNISSIRYYTEREPKDFRKPLPKIIEG